MDARILVVEDDPSIREITAIGLRGAGFTVATAADGPEGLERFRADRPDLILLDVMLPGLDGLEVAREIRRELHTIHAIVATHVASDAALRDKEPLPTLGVGLGTRGR